MLCFVIKNPQKAAFESTSRRRERTTDTTVNWENGPAFISSSIPETSVPVLYGGKQSKDLYFRTLTRDFFSAPDPAKISNNMAANFGKALLMNTVSSFMVGAGFCYFVPQIAPIVMVYTLGNMLWSHYSGKVVKSLISVLYYGVD